VDAFTYPSDEAVKGLLRLTAKSDVSTLAEAVRIAGTKRDLQEDEARLKYIGGILRNKRLEATSPELASRLRNVKWLMKYWRNQPRGTGFLHTWMLADWLKVCTPEEIRAAMDLAGGYYRELREWTPLLNRRPHGLRPGLLPKLRRASSKKPLKLPLLAPKHAECFLTPVLRSYGITQRARQPTLSVRNWRR